jgi:hypothetical protein
VDDGTEAGIFKALCLNIVRPAERR